MKMNETQKGFVLSAIIVADQTSDSVVEERYGLVTGTVQRLRDAIKNHGDVDLLPADLLRKRGRL